MARPLRIEFAGAIYHVTSRGNARAAIFVDDPDREMLLQTLGEVVRRFNWRCHAYCLMDNHYHLLVETVDGNLSAGMRQLNGMFTQRFNRRHGRGGHIFQGRFKAILVDRDSYLLELCRYVALNPVRAKAVKRPGDYRWSSYRATAGAIGAPPFLTCDWTLSQFAKTRAVAQRRYREFVKAGASSRSPWDALQGQVLLGDNDFAQRLKPLLRRKARLNEVPRAQRLVHRPKLGVALAPARLASKHKRDRAIRIAHLKHGYTLAAIGDCLGLHYTTISKIVNLGRA